MTTRHVKVKDLPLTLRPRERLLANGPEGVSSSELLAILLRTGMAGRNVIQVAEELLIQYQTLERLSRVTVPELCKVKGIGRDKAATLVAAFTLARRMAEELRQEQPLLDRAELVADLMREQVRACEVENFFVLLLNTRRRLIQVVPVSQGTLDTLLVHPREVFRAAIAANAAAIVLVHNHPSGDPSPSEADVQVTRDLIRSGKLLKIEVLDHVIIGSKQQGRTQDFTSLRDLGYFYT